MFGNVFYVLILGCYIVVPILAGVLAPFWVAVIVAVAFLVLAAKTQGSPGIIPMYSAILTIAVALVALVVGNWAAILSWLTAYTT